jgi:hypothetical protein
VNGSWLYAQQHVTLVRHSATSESLDWCCLEGRMWGSIAGVYSITNQDYDKETKKCKLILNKPTAACSPCLRHNNSRDLTHSTAERVTCPLPEWAAQLTHCCIEQSETWQAWQHVMQAKVARSVAVCAMPLAQLVTNSAVCCYC